MSSLCPAVTSEIALDTLVATTNSVDMLFNFSSLLFRICANEFVTLRFIVVVDLQESGNW